MKRDLGFILTIITVVLFLLIGTFIRGTKTESITENRKLEQFPEFTTSSFYDASFQQNMESALSDQLLFGQQYKSLYNNIKNKNLDLVINSLNIFNSSNKKTLVTSPSKSTIITSDDTINDNSIDNSHNDSSDTLTKDDIVLNNNLETDLNNNSLTDDPEDLPRVIQKEQMPKPTIISRLPEYNSFEVSLRPRGNNIIELEDSEHLVYPKRSVEDGLSLMTKKTDNYNQTLLNYPDLNYFCYYIESDMDIDFVDGNISHDIVETLFSQLDPRIKTSALYINSPEDYQNFFYKTDHHWDVAGQLQGYKDIIGLLKGEYEPLLDIDILPIDDLKYNGYKSRKVNDYSIKDDFNILMADLPEHTIQVNYKDATYGRKDDYLAGNYSESTGLNYYRDCNGVDYGIVSYDFDQPEKGNLLCYVESFSNPINAFIASHYNKTYFVDYRHYQPTFGSSLDFGDFVSEHDIDDVLFTGYYFFYVNYMFKVTD